MASGNGNESDNTKGSIAALFDEGARLFDDICSPMERTSHGVGTHTVSGSGNRSRWGEWDRALLLCTIRPAKGDFMYHLSTRASTRCVCIVEYRLLIIWLPYIVHVRVK